MTITEIFRTFGPEYLSRYPDMPLAQKKEMVRDFWTST